MSEYLYHSPKSIKRKRFSYLVLTQLSHKKSGEGPPKEGKNRNVCFSRLRLVNTTIPPKKKTEYSVTFLSQKGCPLIPFFLSQCQWNPAFYSFFNCMLGMRREKYFADGAGKIRDVFFVGKEKPWVVSGHSLAKRISDIFMFPLLLSSVSRIKICFPKKGPDQFDFGFSDPLFSCASFERRTYAKQYAKKDVQQIHCQIFLPNRT